MIEIDERLLEPDCIVSLIEDFNRSLVIVDAIEERVSTTEESVTSVQETIEPLATNEVTIVELDVTEIIAGTPYFDVTGTGTELDPYVIKPKTTLMHSKTRYQVSSGSEPEENIYITVQASGTEKCQVEVTHGNVFASKNYYVTTLDIFGKPRARINLSNAIVRTNWSVSAGTFYIAFDVNGTEVYYSSAI